jgi:Pyruvate/2-oxoacid:ferredoxin oxidoreductase gamma subunit
MKGNLLPYAKIDGFDEQTFFIVNATEPLAIEAEQWLIDADRVAIENNLVFGGEPFINVPMLGAIARVLNIPLEYIELAIRSHWQGNKADLNIAAVRQAYAQIKKYEEGDGK